MCLDLSSYQVIQAIVQSTSGVSLILNLLSKRWAQADIIGGAGDW
jgi:hypothetical protein